MKILSYNILRGAFSQNDDRTETVLQLIRDQEADVVGLCECTNFLDNDAARLHLFEKALGMRSVINRAPSGENVAIFYNERANCSATGASAVMMYHGFAHIVVTLPVIGRTTILMTHLHPRSALSRLSEAENVLAKATQEPNAIVMGDFNSIADHELSNIGGLTTNNRIRFLGSSHTTIGAVSSFFLNNGFFDLGAELATPTYPTKKFRGAETVQLRLDFMFGSAEVAARSNFTTISTPVAQAASDHLPLMCELTG